MLAHGPIVNVSNIADFYIMIHYIAADFHTVKYLLAITILRQT